MKKEHIFALCIVVLIVLCGVLVLRVIWDAPDSVDEAFSRDATVTQAAGPDTNNRGIDSKDPRIGGKFSALPILTNAPIEFYGKVVDEDGNALSGVNVSGYTGSAVGFMAHEYREYATVSGVNGMFSFSGIKGRNLGLNFSKSGYNFKTNKKRFEYSAITKPEERHKPDKSKPVEFKMWKVLGPEPLIIYNGRDITMPIDGTPVHVDLAVGKVVSANGDIKIAVEWGERPSKDSIVYRWVLRIEVPEGGLVDGTEEIMFHAPNGGYESKKEYKYSESDNPADITPIFYIKCRNGQSYARVQIYFSNNEIRSICRASLIVQMNPNGSRNLEPGGGTIDVSKLK